jgi:ABC-type uncharacterized transport system permease subunit
VTIMQLAGPARGWPIPAQFLSMLPYLATIIVLGTIASRGHIALGAPAHLAKSFFITR